MKLNRNDALRLGMTEPARVLANALVAAYDAGALSIVCRVTLRATTFDLDRSGDAASFVLSFISELMPGAGDPDVVRAAGWDGYWGDTIALYIPTGDDTDPTIVYEVDNDRFLFMALYDWVALRGDELEII